MLFFNLIVENVTKVEGVESIIETFFFPKKKNHLKNELDDDVSTMNVAS